MMKRYCRAAPRIYYAQRLMARRTSLPLLGDVVMSYAHRWHGEQPTPITKETAPMATRGL